MLITATLDRFESDQAVLVLDSGEKIIWPKTKLPSEIREGQVLQINITVNSSNTKQKENIAKKFLNEILEN